MTDGIPERLSAPVSVSIGLPWPVPEARKRLKLRVGPDTKWENSKSSDRRIHGAVGDDGAVELRVREADWRRRRKSWKVVFGGRLEPSGDASILSGTLTVDDADSLRLMIAILYAGAAAPIVLACVAVIAGLLSGSMQIGPIAFGISIGAIALVGLRYTQLSGEQAAAADGRWLIDKLGSVD